jgi:hypothetical protein
MSVEEAIILRSRPRIMAGCRAHWIQDEIQKGCRPEPSPSPVGLEPHFARITAGRPIAGGDGESHGGGVAETPIPSADLCRLRIWITSTQACDWVRAETFLKQLSQLNRRIVFEIVGNKDGISMGFLVHKEDAPILSVLFRAQYEESEIEQDAAPLMCHVHGLGKRQVCFREFFPSPPYSHLLSSFEEFKRSPFVSLIQALSELDPSIVGFYQCLFQPVRAEHDWHGNVQTLLDIEFEIKLQSSPSLAKQSLQQAPSGSLQSMSHDVEVKAHNDRPFYTCVCRVGIAGVDPRLMTELPSVAAFMSGFQHGGKGMQWVSSNDNGFWIPERLFPAMVRKGITYRPGFLVNSRELAGLVHPTVCPQIESRRIEFPLMEKLSVRDLSLTSGTCLGVCHHAGVEQKVCIPDAARVRSTHIIAKPGMGKSTVMLNMISQDLQRGGGLAFFDAHGDTVKSVLASVPPDLYEKCIYFNPADPDWVPLWNPMASDGGEDIYLRTKELIGSFKQVFPDWGDRLELIISFGMIGLMSAADGGNFHDLYTLTRRDSPEFHVLRARLLPTIEDEVVRQFWMHDFFKDYRRFEIQSPKHKLSKLITSGNASRMFRQYENRIDLDEIMNQGKILLVDLSGVGTEMAQLLGAFMLSLLFTSANRRSQLNKDQRKSFSIYVDEAHLFVGSRGLEDIIVEARKFGVNLCLAHQHLSQFQTRKVDAIASVASTLIGRVNKSDSQFLAEHLQGLVEPKDLIGLEPYEMIGNIDNEVVRFKTAEPPKPQSMASVSQLIEMSRRAYYSHASTFKQAIVPTHIEQPDNWYGDLEEWPFQTDDLAYDTNL